MYFTDFSYGLCSVLTSWLLDTGESRQKQTVIISGFIKDD